MYDYWIYQRRDNGKWEVLEEGDYENLSRDNIVAGTLNIIPGENRADALLAEVDISDIIQRIFNDAQKHGNDYAYDLWMVGKEVERNVERKELPQETRIHDGNQQLTDYI